MLLHRAFSSFRLFGAGFLLQAAQACADGGGKGGIFRNDIVDAVEPLKILEILLRLRQGGEGAGQHNGFRVVNLTGQHRHGADDLAAPG